ncbi:MAG: patatin-like phospholipase family protein [Spirochaetaceae bacterium]|jgi:predicted acylesterase/phospholipase RssA|nr:patatin-like phospholipase family protein [Spirochaetaceae bacterium]
MGANNIKRGLSLLFIVCVSALPGAQEPFPQKAAPPPKVALVLSGGAALGFAHVGFLKVLEEVGIPVDLVAGNSMGSLIGALYAAGYSPGDIEAAANQINWAHIFLNEGVDHTAKLMEERGPFFRVAFDKTGVGESRGLFPDHNITLLLSRLLYRVSMEKDFSTLPLPFRATSVDIVNGMSVPLDRGVLYRAVRSSISLPVVFPPVPMGGTFMVDGALLNNNPVDLALDWGADIIIDIDVGSLTPRNTGDITGMEAVVDQTIRLIQSRNPLPASASGRRIYRINMDLRDFFWTDFAKARELIDRGERIARQPENMKGLLSLARDIAELRPLEKRAWQRAGTYFDLPEPVFTAVRLESITAGGREEDGEAIAGEFPQKYLDTLFGRFFNRPADFSKLESAIELLRRRGDYESIGYRIAPAGEGEYTLILTGTRAMRRKNDISLAFNAAYLQGERASIRFSGYTDLALRDMPIPNSLAQIKLAYDFTDIQGPSFTGTFTKELSRLFSAEIQGDLAYSTTTIQSFSPENELSSLGTMGAWARFIWTPADYLTASLAYRFNPLWYVKKSSALNGDSTSYYGDLHSAVLEVTFNTMDITRPLILPFLYNVDFRFTLEFPFGGSRSTGFPRYERIEGSISKAWTPRTQSNLVFDAGFASYMGDFASRWSLFSPTGKDGIPGYSAMDILTRNTFTLGMTYLEEIVPLSNALNLRSFFALTVRGGSFWDTLGDVNQFGAWIGGARAGIQIETPVGMLFLGPGVSFDGKFLLCVYFN